jgi:hypothetical protein
MRGIYHCGLIMAVLLKHLALAIGMSRTISIRGSGAVMFLYEVVTRDTFYGILIIVSRGFSIIRLL